MQTARVSTVVDIESSARRGYVPVVRSALALFSLLVFSFTPSLEARAVTIQGTFSGTINTSNDSTNTYGLGYGNTLGGLGFTGTFRYDTDLATPDIYPNQDTYGTTGNYAGIAGDWMDMSITVAGRTEQLHDGTNTGNAVWDAVVLDPLFDSSNGLTVIDATQNPASGITDQFAINGADGSTTSVNSGGVNYIWGEQGILNILEYIDDSMIIGDGTIQSFDWTPPGSASGSFSINHQIRGYNEFGVWSLLLNEQVGMNFTITQASASIAPVPEPSTGLLLAGGLALMARSRFR